MAYEVEYSRLSNGNEKAPLTTRVNTNSIKLTDLEEGTAYNIQVQRVPDVPYFLTFFAGWGERYGGGGGM